MGTPTPEHFLFIPGVLMIGMVLGYILGGKTARQQLEKAQRRARE